MNSTESTSEPENPGCFAFCRRLRKLFKQDSRSHNIHMESTPSSHKHVDTMPAQKLQYETKTKDIVYSKIQFASFHDLKIEGIEVTGALISSVAYQQITVTPLEVAHYQAIFHIDSFPVTSTAVIGIPMFEIVDALISFVANQQIAADSLERENYEAMIFSNTDSTPFISTVITEIAMSGAVCYTENMLQFAKSQFTATTLKQESVKIPTIPPDSEDTISPSTSVCSDIDRSVAIEELAKMLKLAAKNQFRDETEKQMSEYELKLVNSAVGVNLHTSTVDGDIDMIALINYIDFIIRQAKSQLRADSPEEKYTMVSAPMLYTIKELPLSSSSSEMSGSEEEALIRSETLTKNKTITFCQEKEDSNCVLSDLYVDTADSALVKCIGIPTEDQLISDKHVSRCVASTDLHADHVNDGACQSTSNVLKKGKEVIESFAIVYLDENECMPPVDI